MQSVVAQANFDAPTVQVQSLGSFEVDEQAPPAANGTTRTTAIHGARRTPRP
jgi:hypothetical protein